jgi:energy-coupling factor transporter ATP-binding protein EcfA2
VANVFISHSSADNDWAEKIYVWLEEDGHNLFLDRDLTDGIVVGDDWERRLYERLRWADAVVCVVSEPYVESMWCAAEIGASLALGIELLPVGVSQKKVEHKLLKTLQGVDGAKDPDAARAALRSRLKVIDGGGGWGWPDGKAPYPGLRSFELGDHRVFFGRSHEVSSITKRLRSSERAQSAILVVVGPSGCGKSSLVRAGVVPRIAGEDYWLSLPPIVPGIDPLGSLVHAIADLTAAQGISFDTKSLRKDIERDGLRAVAHDLLLAAGAASHCKLLVVIDQFEELLTQTEPSERSKFVAALAPALGGPIQVLATMRSEYVDALGKDPDLMNLGTRIHQVRPLESDALREVIEEPAKVAGLSFEDDLVTRLIADTGTGDALPLLAFTLEQLADDMSRGDCMTHRRYDKIGGVQGALQRQADEALAAACDATGKTPDQVIDELLNLVTIDEQGRPSKRRLALGGSSDDEASLRPFLERRLLSTEVADKTTSITVSHDAFLVNWPPLHKEIDAKVIALRTRRVVETAARDWEANERDAAMLLQGPQLAKAIVDTGADFEPDRGGRRLTTRVDLNDSARDFLTESEEADRAEKARAKTKTVRVVALLSVITLVAVIGGGWAVYSQQLAKKSERDAIAQQLIAEARVDLSKAVDMEALQRLLAGRSLAETKVSDDTLYPVVVGSASTFKIMQNPLRPEDDQPLPVHSVAVSRDGALIAAGSNDNTLRLWNARSGALVREILLTGPSSVGTVAFDPSGTRIAVGSNDGTLQVIDAQNGERIGTLMHLSGCGEQRGIRARRSVDRNRG